MKKILIVAYHFPPQSGSSGFLRSLKFARYLPEYDWKAVVLTVTQGAYERLDLPQAAAVSAETSVLRAFALDAKKHLSIAGKHPGWLSIPDRWMSWALCAIPMGLHALRRYRIDVILTTFPIATSVLIGLILQRVSGRPWVIDFRDSMTEENYPRDPRTRRVWRWLESQGIKHGTRFLFTAEAARQMYLQRYPALSMDQCRLIPNGFDEEDFRDVQILKHAKGAGRCLRLVHSGLLYPDDRDPKPFFRALRRLKTQNTIGANGVRIDLRASGFEPYYLQLIRELGIDDIVHLLPPLPYHESLKDLASADALLLIQAASCNHQIPAKTYEYMRIEKPILALTPEAGDTARLLREVGGATIVDPTDENSLYHSIRGFLESVSNRQHPLPDYRLVQQYTRKNQAHQLARCLDQIVGPKPPSRHHAGAVPSD